MEGVRLVEERRWKRRTGSHLRAFESPTFRTLETPADCAGLGLESRWGSPMRVRLAPSPPCAAS